MPVMSSGLLGELSSLAVHVALPDVHKAIVKAHWNKERKYWGAVSAK